MGRLMTYFSKARMLAFIIPSGLMAGAYISQYIGGLYPCEMCWWQRYPHFAAIPLAGLAFFVRNLSMRYILVILAALAILTSGLIGGFHAGVEYHWWEGLTTCSMTATGSGDDFLKSIMEAPLIRCDVAQWTFLGISLAGYNFLLSTGGAALIMWLLWKNKAH
jgi:disulfide bond formation protein DsbB